MVLSFPPVWITVGLRNTPHIKIINRRTQENLLQLNYIFLLILSHLKKTLPVIHNQNNFSCFESQLVIFSCLKVVQRADLSDLLHSTSAAVALGVRVQGPSLRLQLLLLQGQFDGWEGEEGGKSQINQFLLF